MTLLVLLLYGCAAGDDVVTLAQRHCPDLLDCVGSQVDSTAPALLCSLIAYFSLKARTHFVSVCDTLTIVVVLASSSWFIMTEENF